MSVDVVCAILRIVFQREGDGVVPESGVRDRINETTYRQIIVRNRAFGVGPQAYVISSWHVTQPGSAPLERLLGAWPGVQRREVFATEMLPSNRRAAAPGAEVEIIKLEAHTKRLWMSVVDSALF